MGLFPVLPLVVPQLPAVWGGLFELFVLLLHCADSVGVDIDFGDVGASLHPTRTAVTSRSELPMILIACSSVRGVGAFRAIDAERRQRAYILTPIHKPARARSGRPVNPGSAEALVGPGEHHRAGR